MQNLYKLTLRIISLCILLFYPFKSYALIPYYYLPEQNILKKNIDEINKGAIYFLDINKIDDAVKRAYISHSLDKTYLLSSLILTEALILKKDFKAAKKIINIALRHNKNEPKIYYLAARINFLEDNLKKSKKYIDTALKINENNIDLLFILGNIYLKKNLYSKAIEVYEKILKINNSFWPAHNNIGLANFELGKIEFSKNNFIAALKYTNNPESMLGLSVVLFKQNPDNKESFNIAKKAILESPKFINAEFRESELWGEEIQKITSKFFRKYKELNAY